MAWLRYQFKVGPVQRTEIASRITEYAEPQEDDIFPRVNISLIVHLRIGA